MNPVESIWRALVQRRLLPVAILLIAALAAIPVVLAKDTKPAPAAPAPAAGGDDERADSPTLDEPIVSLVADGERTKRRRVLGARKNPFEPAAGPKPTATPQPAVRQGGTALPAAGAEPPKTDTGGGTVTTGPSAPPAEPKPEKELYSLTVRFGPSEGETLPKMNLPRLKALPNAEEPILVYLGLSGDGKTAVFMVDASVEPQGDGTCRPDGATCETIHMRVGDTEFFDVKDETGNVTSQYQLDLLAIKRKTTASSSKARTARAKVAAAGRKVLRAHEATVGPLRYRYDRKSGTLRKLDKRAYRAAVARAARAAFAAAGGFDITR
jgi:hypothetical protein